MLLTGDPISAERALELGMVSDVVDDAEVVETADELAAKIAQASSATVAIGKEAFYRQINMTVEDAYSEMSRTMAANAVIEDAQEGIDAFLTKREPTWQGR
jgi:enoyl-CoA hydratase/carnithine racemase